MAATHHAASDSGVESNKDDSLKDACWSYRPIEYVPRGPQPTSSLFDRDAQELETLYSSAVRSMSAKESDQVVQDRVRQAEERLLQFTADAIPPGGGPAEATGTTQR